MTGGAGTHQRYERRRGAFGFSRLGTGAARFRDHVAVTVSASPASGPETFVVCDMGLVTYAPR